MNRLYSSLTGLAFVVTAFFPTTPEVSTINKTDALSVAIQAVSDNILAKFAWNTCYSTFLNENYLASKGPPNYTRPSELNIVTDCLINAASSHPDAHLRKAYSSALEVMKKALQPENK